MPLDRCMPANSFVVRCERPQMTKRCCIVMSIIRRMRTLKHLSGTEATAFVEIKSNRAQC